MNISMPLVTIEKIKSGLYLSQPFEYQGQIYIGKKGLLGGFQGKFVEASSATVSLKTYPNSTGYAAVNDYQVWRASVGVASNNSAYVDDIASCWSRGTSWAAQDESLFEKYVAAYTAAGDAVAWWTYHVDWGRYYPSPTNGYDYHGYGILVAGATIQYLGRVNGDTYGFSSTANAQKWIDHNMERDAQNRPKTGAPLKRKLAGMGKYAERVSASLALTPRRKFADESKRSLVTQALLDELNEVQRRMALEASGNF
ncbi:hypothetical protein [Glaciimonas soli]|uniref:Uncharacterized protein n=1 Tax=Glaciimonas soli TaxID=2590999 RepID=A0A843YJU6_9BURK|nr:hypothetical protein [Glaciimonas soli]MQQ99249.1 hypothetical protein [Glaciimonas soli]